MPLTKNQALPGAIIVFNRDAFRGIITKVASAPKDGRASRVIIVVKPGSYRCNSNEVVLYNHFNNELIKGDLISVRQCLVSEITEDEQEMMSFRGLSDSLLNFLKDYVSDGLNLNSPLTLFKCRNMRGKLIDDQVIQDKFHATLTQSVKE